MSNNTETTIRQIKTKSRSDIKKIYHENYYGYEQ